MQNKFHLYSFWPKCYPIHWSKHLLVNTHRHPINVRKYVKSKHCVHFTSVNCSFTFQKALLTIIFDPAKITTLNKVPFVSGNYLLRTVFRGCRLKIVIDFRAWSQRTHSPLLCAEKIHICHKTYSKVPLLSYENNNICW